jgi:hypothetical protein
LSVPTSALLTYLTIWRGKKQKNLLLLLEGIELMMSKYLKPDVKTKTKAKTKKNNAADDVKTPGE